MNLVAPNNIPEAPSWAQAGCPQRNQRLEEEDKVKGNSNTTLSSFVLMYKHWRSVLSLRGTRGGVCQHTMDAGVKATVWR